MRALAWPSAWHAGGQLLIIRDNNNAPVVTLVATLSRRSVGSSRTVLKPGEDVRQEMYGNQGPLSDIFSVASGS